MVFMSELAWRAHARHDLDGHHDRGGANFRTICVGRNRNIWRIHASNLPTPQVVINKRWTVPKDWHQTVIANKLMKLESVFFNWAFQFFKRQRPIHACLATDQESVSLSGEIILALYFLLQIGAINIERTSSIGNGLGNEIFLNCQRNGVKFG